MSELEQADDEGDESTVRPPAGGTMSATGEGCWWTVEQGDVDEVEVESTGVVVLVLVDERNVSMDVRPRRDDRPNDDVVRGVEGSSNPPSIRFGRLVETVVGAVTGKLVVVDRTLDRPSSQAGVGGGLSLTIRSSNDNHLLMPLPSSRHSSSSTSLSTADDI